MINIYRLRKEDLLIVTQEFSVENRELKKQLAKIKSSYEAQIVKTETITISKEEEFKKEIDQLKKLFTDRSDKVARAKYRFKIFGDKYRGIIRNLKVEYKALKDLNQYSSKDFDWNNTNLRRQHVEIMLRTIVTFNNLYKTGVTSYNEVIFLFVGSQREFFNMDDIVGVAGNLGGVWKKDFKACEDAGYFKRMHRKSIWNITYQGRERFESILKYIYNKRLGTKQRIRSK